MTYNSLVRCAIHAFFTNICVREITAFVILFFLVIRAFGRKCDRHLIFTVVIRYDICVALWDLRYFENRLQRPYHWFVVGTLLILTSGRFSVLYTRIALRVLYTGRDRGSCE